MNMNMSIRQRVFGLACGLVLAGVAGAASADIPSYPSPGTPRTSGVNFTAFNSGSINVWFAGKGSAGDTDEIEAIVNGDPTGIVAVNNQTSTLGEYFNLGSVTAGDTVQFEMINEDTGSTFYSNVADSGGDYHAYSAPFAGGIVGSTWVPSSRYFGFEDLSSAQGSDWNYLDDQFFVKTGVVPEPASWALMLIGVAGIGMGLRELRRSRRIAV
jgi:hypothetical protein